MATQDTCITIHPYFKVSEGNLEAFKGFCEQFVELTSARGRWGAFSPSRSRQASQFPRP